MRGVFLGLGLMLVASAASAGDTCFESFSEAASYGSAGNEYSTAMEFGVGKLIQLPGQVLVLLNGQASENGEVFHLMRVVGTDGSESLVSSQFSVVDGEMARSQHCVTDTKLAL
jgi:hypothetical protein